MLLIGARVQDNSDDDEAEEEALAGACVPSGSYVTITLEGVPPTGFAGLSPKENLLAHTNSTCAGSKKVRCNNSYIDMGLQTHAKPMRLGLE
jgi:hypothetical protein